MFKKNRYITKGVNEKLSQEVISAIWELLANHTMGRKLDYFQIFELKNVKVDSGDLLEITWKQEQPNYMLKVVYPDLKIKENVKVWVICDAPDTEEEISTMLLPEEY